MNTSTSREFTRKYISETISLGISSPKEIVKKANSDISDLEKKIKEAEDAVKALYQQKIALQNVKKCLSFSDLKTDTITHINKIVYEYLKDIDITNGVMPKDIMNHLMSSDSLNGDLDTNRKNIYVSITNLRSKGIIKFLDDSKIVPGPKWGMND